MKYNSECMTDVIQCITDNLKFADDNPNGNFGFEPLSILTIYNNDKLEKYDTNDIKLCLCILNSRNYIIVYGSRDTSDWNILGVTYRWYEDFYPLSNKN